ncbi:TonB-dependent receptor [Rheinheimera sp.]|uniref:TonB-dependent receptor n=1 Tax=Rheinheimera sp. TaxID=1869214 RepID=UPI0027359E6E|nr:TonB-dependent receptor [Rheinheimera sp.]MDP2715249.1 TonB-dependent receptor [Rheinheimera sp.]
MKIKSIALAVTLAIGMTNVASANTGQSSAIRGSVVGPLGNPAPNSVLTIIHSPSGTVKEVSVNEQGQFNATGLRVGGPYTIIIKNSNLEGKVFDNVYLDLNDALQLNAQLAERSDVETITVTGSRNFFSNSGSASYFGEDQIANSATFNRDIKDIARLNPLAVLDPSGTELSIAGSNPKYNSLTVDGVGLNDTFGLNANGYPAQRPPISLDAVEQISIEYAPFKARAGKFSGGTINVVTKSGTNELSGSAFYEYVPWSGTAKDDKLVPGREFEVENDEQTIGATLGGAIVQDKLFFFAAYDKWEEDVVFNYDMTTLDGHDVTLEQADRVINILRDVYGLDDSIGGAPPADRDEKLLLKLDWNINSNHRADFTYSYQENQAARNFTNSDSTLNLSSNAWSQDSETTFITTHLYSDWTPDFSTEISWSYKEYSQNSTTASNWGEINIDVVPGFDDRGPLNGPDIVAGRDENRHANVLENETMSLGIHSTYLAGDVEYRFGVELEDVWNYNLYGRHGAGTWFFNSIEEFEAKAPSGLTYSNAYTNDLQDIAYDVDSMQYSLYAEAEFELFTDFMVTAGLRYERLDVSGEPMLNQNFVDTYGYANTENMDGADILLPRVGFNWNLAEDITVRGGVGRYSGGMPLVWVSNAYTNDGFTKVNANPAVVNEAIQDPANVDFTDIPQAVKDSMVPGAGSTNTIARGFKMPSDWRYQLAVDYIFDLPVLGNNFSWSNEINYVDRENSPYWVDLSRVKVGETVEGRTIWGSVYEGGAAQNWDLELRNIDDGGRSIIFSSALQKQWNNGFSMSASYTHQDITEVNPGTSSTAESNFGFEVTENRNDPLLGRAYYEVEHRFVVNLNYKTEFFSGYETNFNLFFERRSGEPFSWTLGSFQDDDFGDQPNFDDNDIYLPYLPSGANDPAFDFVNGLSYEEIVAIAQAAGVSGSAGGYVEKYSANQPWLTTMDLAITQELPGFVEGHKGKLYFVIDNFANLLNNDWGKSYRMQFPQQILFDFDVNAQGQYVLQEAFGGTDTRTYDTFDVSESTWNIKVGFKYTF